SFFLYPEMSIDMSSNFFKLLLHFRRHDLRAFTKEHDDLFKEAKNNGNHLAVTSHYYSVMSGVIDQYFNGNFHFAPPEDDGQLLEEALRDLHLTIGDKLKLKEGVRCLDIGCGIGGVIKDLSPTGADLTGVTIAANEVEMGNADFARQGMSSHCRLIEGDAHDMPLPEGCMDAAYAVYSLKYFPKIDKILEEVSRVLKPGGKFLIYDLIKTEEYDENNEEHTEVIEGLEYACGMPSLHSRAEMVEEANKFGLTLCHEEDLSVSHNRPFHYCFSHSPFFMWLVKSPIVDSLIKIGQVLRILPEGFSAFNRIFLSGTVQKIVDGGEMGILSGSQIFVFEKEL
ncbi:hypothetical protein PMAYCL1PPCAC_12821, partial [Pristionchus mayeri]